MTLDELVDLVGRTDGASLVLSLEHTRGRRGCMIELTLRVQTPPWAGNEVVVMTQDIDPRVVSESRARVSTTLRHVADEVGGEVSKRVARPISELADAIDRARRRKS